MCINAPYPADFENTSYFLDQMNDFDPQAPLAGTPLNVVAEEDEELP